MENPIKMDDLEGKPTIFGNIHMELLVPKVGPSKPGTTWINLHQRIQVFSGGTGHSRIHTWRIIPVSKWLITMDSKSPKSGYSHSKWTKWLINGGY